MLLKTLGAGPEHQVRHLHAMRKQTNGSKQGKQIRQGYGAVKLRDSLIALTPCHPSFLERQRCLKRVGRAVRATCCKEGNTLTVVTMVTAIFDASHTTFPVSPWEANCPVAQHILRNKNKVAVDERIKQ